MIIWIMGLSGSGKTTVGKILKKKLKQNHNIVHLDGDTIRKIYSQLFDCLIKLHKDID